MNKTAISVILFSASLATMVSAKEPQNIYLIKRQLTQYHESGDYMKDLTEIASQARKYLALRITENKTSKHQQKLAIVLDIDETVLSNYPYMHSHGYGGSLNAFEKNIARHQLPSIAPMKSLYKFALQNKVAVFFVTGRKEHFRQATETNLKATGFNRWTSAYFKPESYHQASVIPFKTAMRKKIKELGYTVVESIGDQQSDFKGGFVEKGFKLPNPYYYIP